MAWREGYADGCNRGYVAAGHPYYRYAKDVERGQIDALYAEGWRDGFQVCKSRYDAIGQTRV
jgi:hypothetical protein